MPNPQIEPKVRRFGAAGWLLVFGAATPLLLWLFDCSMSARWVGSTDLTVEFAIVDASSGAPIPGARIELQTEHNPPQAVRELVTDSRGTARSEFPDQTCAGSQSRLRFTDTYFVYAPLWRFRATSDGYERSEWMSFEAPELKGKAQRTGPRRAKLLAAVSLHKKPADEWR